MRIIYILFFLVLPVVAISQRSEKAKSIIFDSDMGPDYDDVGAITLLYAFADSGYIRILATIASTNYEGVAAVFSVFNIYFKRPDIPIAVPKKNGVNIRDPQHWSDTLLANYPHTIVKNDEVPEAVVLYRKVLAGQPDKSVTIVTTGFLTNLTALLQSQPDEFSKLNGQQLVKKKVKQLVSMAGSFPSGSEYNVRIDSTASQFLFTHWPSPILLSGFEIGWPIRTGLPLINNDNIQKSPVKDVFRISIPMNAGDKEGRMSWDQTAVLVAAKGFEPFFTLRKGTMIVNDNGSNGWSPKGKNHAYLIARHPPEFIQNLINQWMMHQPR